MGPFNAYNFVVTHPILSKYGNPSVLIDVVKVNPVNDMVDRDSTKNTKVRYWIEIIVKCEDGHYSHKSELDCGGETIERALSTLYQLVVENYGDFPYQHKLTSYSSSNIDIVEKFDCVLRNEYYLITFRPINVKSKLGNWYETMWETSIDRNKYDFKLKMLITSNISKAVAYTLEESFILAYDQQSSKLGNL